MTTTTVATLFVARDLDHWVTDAEEQFGYEVEIGGKKFLRLTPRIYRWLRQQVAKAEQLCAEGKLSQAQHAQIVMAFVPVYEFAKEHGLRDTPPLWK